MKVARVIGIVGRVLVAAGVLLLFYTAYLLWGTSVYTRKVQNEAAKQVERNPIVTNVSAGNLPPARPAMPPKLGDPLFTIVIPKIGLRTVVVQGVGVEQLKRGPGHFPACSEVPQGTDCAKTPAWPGEHGNVPISGHRTTFGAPFFRINELQPGDTIAIESGPVRYRYTVTEQLVVAPEQVDVVENRGQDELTLTSCNPRFSASQRMVIHARYDGPELIAATKPGPNGTTIQTKELVPAPPPAVPRETIILSLLSVVAFLSAMGLSNRLRMPAIWAAFLLAGGIGLWTSVFPQILRMMPANY